MADIAVRCRSCRKVTHWLTNFKKVWQCPLCHHPSNVRVLDGRQVAERDDCYTVWRTECKHEDICLPYEPSDVFNCRQCNQPKRWYKYRDLGSIVPVERTTHRKEEEDTLAMKVINVLLDRLIEKK